jgi:hypothetical protein
MAGSISRNLGDSLTKIPREGVLDDLDHRIGSGQSRLENERGRRHSRPETEAVRRIVIAGGDEARRRE